MKYIASNRNIVAIVSGNQHTTEADDEMRSFYTTMNNIDSSSENRHDLDDGGFILVGHTASTDKDAFDDEFECISSVARLHARKLKQQGCGREDILVSTEYIFGKKIADGLDLISDNNYYLPRGL